MRPHSDAAAPDQPTPTPASKDPELPSLSKWLREELRKRCTRISEAARRLGLDSKRLHNALHHNSFTKEEISAFAEFLGIENLDSKFAYKQALTKSLVAPVSVSREIKEYAVVTAGGVETLTFFDRFFRQLSQRAKIDGSELKWLLITVPNSVSDQQFSECALTEKDAEIIRHWKCDGVSGIFFVPTEWFQGAETLNRILLEALKQTGLPIVMIDRDIGPYPKRDPDVSIVQIDHFKCGYHLGNHLVLQGFSRPLFVQLPYSSTEPVVLRKMGITAALRQSSPGVSNGHSVEIETTNSSSSLLFSHQSKASDEADIRSILDSYDTNKCDVLIFHNDDTAGRFINSLFRNPSYFQRASTLRFASFDDLGPDVWWTSVKQPMDQLVSAAYEVMETLVARRRSAEPESPIRRMIEPVFGEDQQRPSTAKESLKT